MKDRRRSDLGSEQSRPLEVRLSRDTCDVYGCVVHDRYGYGDWSIPGPYYGYSHPSHSTKHGGGGHRRTAPKGVVKYFFDALAKSSINGISNCTASKSLVGKLIWLALFTLCICGFTYQASHFYQLYRNKPSVVQIEVENDGEVDFPAVTVCNTNRVRKSAFCRHFPKRCETDENIRLSESQINELLYDLLLEKRENVRKDLGHSNSMFVSCNFIGTPVVTDNECLKIWETFYDPDYGNCYTFSSKKDSKPLQARKVDFWQEENDLTLVLNSEPLEFMEKKRAHGLLLVVHDERAFPDLHTEGLLVTPGNSYTITVAKSTVLLLPPPYKTNCTEYGSLAWQKMHDRRLTSRLCTVGCSQHFQFQNCQLVTKNLSLFYDKLPYEKKDINEEKINCSINEERRTIDYCRSICGLPCRETLYTATVSSSKLSSTELNADYVAKHKVAISEDIIYVRIFYSTLEHKIFRHIPKYDTMELFSFLGGYSGVWLGFSLLTVYEMLEITASTVAYFFRTRLGQRRLLRTLINPIRKRHKAAIRPFKKKKYYS